MYVEVWEGKRIQVGQARETKPSALMGQVGAFGSMLPIGNQPENTSQKGWCPTFRSPVSHHLIRRNRKDPNYPGLNRMWAPSVHTWFRYFI